MTQRPAPASSRTDGGFTLVEMMVAILVMMVGMVGLLQAVDLALEHNLLNQLREESVYLGEKYLNDLRGRSFGSYSVTPARYTAFPVQSAVRGGGVTYTVQRVVTDISSSDHLTKQLQVTVSWTHKRVAYQNRVTAPVSQAP